MTLLETLQAHRGGLLHIKSELYWYGSGGWDGAPGRICLLLDAAYPSAAATGATATARWRGPLATVLLLIDGQPQWIWVGKEDVEIL